MENTRRQRDHQRLGVNQHESITLTLVIIKKFPNDLRDMLPKFAEKVPSVHQEVFPLFTHD